LKEKRKDKRKKDKGKEKKETGEKERERKGKRRREWNSQIHVSDYATDAVHAEPNGSCRAVSDCTLHCGVAGDVIYNGSCQLRDAGRRQCDRCGTRYSAHCGLAS